MSHSLRTYVPQVKARVSPNQPFGVSLRLAALSAEALVNAPQYGSLFESLVVANFIRCHSAQGEVPEHCYLDAKGITEIDLLCRSGQSWVAYEIKSGLTVTSASFRQLERARSLLKADVKRYCLAAPVAKAYRQEGIEVVPWWNLQC